MTRSRNTPGDPPGLPELDRNQRQRFTRIAGVVWEGGATDAARFFFPSNTDEERMQPCRLSRMKHGHGTGAGRDHRSIGKADPLVSILIQELVADSPIACLVLAPVRVELPGDLGGQLIGNAFHGPPQGTGDSSCRSRRGTHSFVGHYNKGYFFGAMYFSYGIGVVIIFALVIFVHLAVPDLALQWTAVVGWLLYLPLTPAVFRYSRVLWIHFDRSFDRG